MEKTDSTHLAEARQPLGGTGVPFAVLRRPGTLRPGTETTKSETEPNKLEIQTV